MVRVPAKHQMFFMGGLPLLGVYCAWGDEGNLTNADTVWLFLIQSILRKGLYIRSNKVNDMLNTHKLQEAN